MGLSFAQQAVVPMTEGVKQRGVEILCVGTELLLGNVLNSNACWLAKELAALGQPHHHQTVVGNNPTHLASCVQEAAVRCSVLLTVGGLGPALDNFTTRTLASTFDTPLEERLELRDEIKTKVIALGITPDPNQYCQAYLPRGASILPNPLGTATGMIWSPRPGFTILTFPEAPSEMKEMWQCTAVPWLQQRSGSYGSTLVSRTLRFSGISEFTLIKCITSLMCSENLTVAPHTSLGDLKLRLVARNSNAEQAKLMLDTLEREILLRTGHHCYSCNGESLTSVVLDLLRKRSQTLAVAESCTGGSLGATLTTVPKCSNVFLGGIIAYNNVVKHTLLGVPVELIDKYGAVSRPVVEAMAAGCRKRLASDWSLAISGVAGPGGGTSAKPVGLVCLALEGPGLTASWQKRFSRSHGRSGIQTLSAIHALDSLRLALC